MKDLVTYLSSESEDVNDVIPGKVCGVLNVNEEVAVDTTTWFAQILLFNIEILVPSMIL